jgi:hypothetical protein
MNPNKKREFPLAQGYGLLEPGPVVLKTKAPVFAKASVFAWLRRDKPTRQERLKFFERDTPRIVRMTWENEFGR